MKEKINALIDKLASKELTPGCRVILGGCLYEIHKRYDDEYLLCGEYPSDHIVLSGAELNRQIDNYHSKVIGHPILIGDVLKRMTGLMIDKPELGQQLLGYWCDCGFKNSFQQIVSDSGWAEYCCGVKPLVKTDPEYKCSGCSEQLKDPSAHALAEFLLDIFKS